MKKVLFLHGFFASGSCEPACALREALKGVAEVLSPDLPMHPQEALEAIRAVIDREHPDVLVGNSCGAFYAQMVAPVVGIPALLGNPHMAMTEFLKERVGEHRYKSPRQDGNQTFVIDQQLVDEFAVMQRHQFDCCNPYSRDRVWGLFGDNDTLARYEPLFSEHYAVAHHFPGAHTPTGQEVKDYYAPLVMQLLERFPVAAERRFRHFKGGMYRYVCSALDSETQERKVVYQALYGNGAFWVRPEKMFFETIERDGRRMARFTEVDQ
ncbi:MAG: alpha/beta fold hydrolase [Muribaculaceae bacterium]|nr:alpha/beta fold hydrolase [Muribaculaceae bacterium]